MINGFKSKSYTDKAVKVIVYDTFFSHWSDDHRS
jgi:hypothetical protein